jgi:ABC-type glutathione transport system ATPase component
VLSLPPARLPAPLQTTRVLVTHQLQYLPAADQVVALRAGRLAEQGGYQELLARGVDFHQFELKKAAQTESEIGGSQPSAAAAALARGSSGLHDSTRDMQSGEEQAGAAAAAAADASGSICAAAESAAVFTDVPLLDMEVDGSGSPAAASGAASVAVVQQANGHSGRASIDLKVGGLAAAVLSAVFSTGHAF